MGIVVVSADELRKDESRDCRSVERHREWCLRLESGDILLFPETPFRLHPDRDAFLRSLEKEAVPFHRNVFYRPAKDELVGLAPHSLSKSAEERLRAALSEYSKAATEFLRVFLAPYQARWQVDDASFHPMEEQGRELPMRRRNDLLHTEARPTRPTHGARILSFFTNIHPTRTRDWITSEPFGKIVGTFAPRSLALPEPRSLGARALSALAASLRLGRILPSLKRSPYDTFMLRFNHFLKENSNYQASCPKLYTRFPPGSSWMVYSETVPHAVLSGQFALEQTFLVEAEAQLDPSSAPIAILERMTGASLR